MENPRHKSFICCTVIVLAVIIFLATYWGMKATYYWFYEGMVEETVKEMVKEEMLE